MSVVAMLTEIVKLFSKLKGDKMVVSFFTIYNLAENLTVLENLGIGGKQSKQHSVRKAKNMICTCPKIIKIFFNHHFYHMYLQFIFHVNTNVANFANL